MQIVTDSGTDLWLLPEQVAELGIHIVRESDIASVKSISEFAHPHIWVNSAENRHIWGWHN
jgi:hypothetical protein